MTEMTTILLERGKVKGRGIVFPKRLTLPEGTEVMVRIEPVVESAKIMARTEDLDLGDLPFFGMWADREDMKDSVAWVRKEREQWHQRATRLD